MIAQIIRIGFAKAFGHIAKSFKDARCIKHEQFLTIKTDLNEILSKACVSFLKNSGVVDMPSIIGIVEMLEDIDRENIILETIPENGAWLGAELLGIVLPVSRAVASIFPYR